MRKSEFWLAYVLLLFIQLIFTNYFRFTPYITLSILHIMVLCIPIRVRPIAAMIIAFASGLFIDWLSEGVLGLNALALVPVAALRDPIIRLIFGGELFARGEDFTPHRSGFGRVFTAMLLAQAVFLLVYIWIDGAGSRPFWFAAARFGASLAVGLLVSVFTLDALAPDRR